MMKGVRVFVFCIVFLLSFSVLSSSTKFINIYVKSQKFLAEIADTPELTVKGLMYRKSIPKYYAMLFVFNDIEKRSFWMKNTLISLDIVFLNEDKEVINFFVNVPPCKKEPCKTYLSEKPAKYVVEFRGNTTKKLKLKRGEVIDFLY